MRPNFLPLQFQAPSIPQAPMNYPAPQQVPQQRPAGITELEALQAPQGGYGTGFGGFITSPDISQGLIGAGQAILGSGYKGNPAAGIFGFNEGMQKAKQQRIENAYKMLSARSLFGGKNGAPAPLQLANAYREALDSGDTEKANQIAAFAKVYDKGVVVDESGNFTNPNGYGSAVGNIAGQKKGAEQNAKNRSDLNYAADINSEEAKGTERGKAEGTIEKKIINAPALEQSLQEAETLLPKATSGGLNTAIRGANRFFNNSTESSPTDTQLEVISANLTSNVPRMEGPQSDADVVMYKKAAGDVGNSKIPYSERLAAVQTIRKLNQKYLDQNVGDKTINLGNAQNPNQARKPLNQIFTK